MAAKYALVAAVLLAVAVSGCSTAPGPEPAGTGTLVLQITDAPGVEAQSVVVAISNVQVHAAGQGNASEGNWTTVVQGPKTYDLVSIKDVKEFLGEAELPAGSYTQLRLDVVGANATINGTLHELDIPSGAIKLARGFAIEENKTSVLTLDFDAGGSIHETGQGTYQMRPTVIVAQEASVSGAAGCARSGGRVSSASCCLSSGSFPDSCAIGACGCSPENSHQVRVCECPEGKCFDGSACVAM